MISPFALLQATFLCSLVGSVLAFALQRWPGQAVLWGYGLALLTSGLGIGTALLFFFNPQPQHLFFFSVFAPIGASFDLLLDPLAAFFLLVLSVGGLLASLYAIGYSQTYRTRRKNLGLFVSGYHLFFLSMLTVAVANNTYLFLLAWEGMSLVSYFLVSFEHESPQVRKAGLLYLIMTHLGTAFLLGMFLILFVSTGQNLSFDAFRLGAGGMSAMARDLVFLCALVGFGTKAGLMPLHFWLPRAHPIAPSHVSALMSGVMITLAIYGLVRVSFDFLGSNGQILPPIWWGLLLLSLGLLSAVLGVLYALMESDLKRLLAWSSIENMGIMCLGLGAALLFHSLRIPFAHELVALSLFAAFFHLLNHTLFKGTLFLGAGAILHATHTGNLDRLGGLLKRMPWTGLCFLISALASAGLPPLNGFVSEWLTYQTLLATITSAPGLWVKAVCILALSGLAFTSALAATTFVKAFGAGFLAQPRSEAAAQAHEVNWTMRLGMLGGALGAVTLGVTSPAILLLLRPTLEQWAGVGSTHLLATRLTWSLPPSATPNASNAPGGNLVVLSLVLPLLIACVGWVLVRWLAGPARVRRGEIWACGVILKPSMEYDALAFVKPLRRVFQTVLRLHRETRASYLVEPYIIERLEYHSAIASFFASPLARALRRGGFWWIKQAKTFQNGSLRLYLGYILAIMVILLLVAR